MSKILLVANTDFYLYNFRLTLFEALRERGHELALVSPVGRYVPLIEEAGFRHIPWDIDRKAANPWNEMKALLQLRKIYRAEQPDLVHHFTIKPVLYGSLVSITLGISGVCNSITGRGYVLLANDLRARLMRPVVKMLYRFAFANKHCMVIFENEEDQADFIKNRLVAPVRTRLIRGVGVDTKRFFPLPEPDGDPIVTYVGRLLWDKGIKDLIEAAVILKDAFGVHIRLVGRPDPGNPSSIPEEDIREWVEKGLITWDGWQDDVKEVYDSSHLIVLPSYYEGVPTVLLEAAACGRAIVASDIPGCRTVVDDGVNGLIVPAHDPEVGAILMFAR